MEYGETSHVMSPLVRKSIKLVTEAFLVGIKSVQPGKLVSGCVHKQGPDLLINGHHYPLQDTYVIGFGKAVYSMATSLEQVLNGNGSRFMKKCMLSIPVGSVTKLEKDDQSLFELYEGAAGNLPDEASATAAKKIVDLASSMKETDLLIVLISGGGSALLPMPMNPMTLEEKRKLIKNLSTSGASIEEMNIIRRAISSVKGGRLGQRIKCQAVSLIISDVIGDDLETIASGPTVPNETTLGEIRTVLDKFTIQPSPALKKVLEKYSQFPPPLELPHIDNYLIGTNTICLREIHKLIKMEDNFEPFLVTSTLEGQADHVGKTLAELSLFILDSLNKQLFNENLNKIFKELKIDPSISKALEKSILNGDRKNIFLLFGGETTVVVKGEGKGGRNQELVLAAGLELEKLSKTLQPRGSVVILSGGTDGIDGPTDAAGGVTWYNGDNRTLTCSIGEGRKEGMNPESYLQNNDSYNYFDKVSQGIYHLKTGHTGTNVMDVQLICINPC